MKTNRLLFFLFSLSLIAGFQPTSFAMEGEISQGSKRKATEMLLKAEKGEQRIEVAELLFGDGTKLGLDQTELDLFSSFSETIGNFRKDMGEVKEIGLPTLPRKTVEWIRDNLGKLGCLKEMGNLGSKDTVGQRRLINDLVQGISNLEDIGAFGCAINYLDMPELQKLFELYLYTHGFAAIGNSSGYKALEKCINQLPLTQQVECGLLKTMIKHKPVPFSALLKAIASGNCSLVEDPKHELYFTSFSPNGRYCAHANDPEEETGMYIEDYEQGTTKELSDINEKAFAISPDGKFIAYEVDCELGWFLLREVESSQEIASAVSHARFPWLLTSMAWNPNGSQLAVLSGDGVISVWSVSELDAPQLIKRVEIDPEGTKKLHCDVFDQRTCELINPEDNANCDIGFDCLKWSSDGKTLTCIANKPDFLYVVDVKTWEVVKQPYDSHILNDISPDGVYTAELCGNNCIAIYDTKQRNRLVSVVNCEDQEAFGPQLFWSENNALVKVASGRTLWTYDFEKSKQFFKDFDSLSLLQKLCLFWIIENKYTPSHLQGVFNTLPEDIRQLYGCLVGRTLSKSGLTEEDLSVWLDYYGEENDEPEQKRRRPNSEK